MGPVRFVLIPTALVVALSVALVVGLGLLAPAASPVGAARTASLRLPAPTTTRHFVTNLHGAVSGPRRTGFTVFDTGDSLRAVRALPKGVKALVWLGQKCPTAADKRFRTTVRRLSHSPRVLGYYLSDEPHIADCPKGPQGLASRSAFVRKVSGDRQKSFLVLSDNEDYHAFRPAVTGVSMVGLDPYPCSVAHPWCQIRQINEAVRVARAKGIPLRKIVPVYQAFGQENTGSHYYNLPKPAKERAMIARWAKLVPHPPMDYTYGWGNQSSADPTLVDSAELKQVFRSYFAG